MLFLDGELRSLDQKGARDPPRGSRDLAPDLEDYEKPSCTEAIDEEAARVRVGRRAELGD